MSLLFWLFVGACLIAIVVAMVQKVVKLALTAGVVLFLVLTGYYFIVDNAPAPIAEKVEAVGGKVKDASGKAATAVGGKVVEAGRDVGGKVVEAGKEAGQKAAQEAGSAASKAGERIVDGAAQGAKAAVQGAIQGQPPASTTPPQK